MFHQMLSTFWGCGQALIRPLWRILVAVQTRKEESHDFHVIQHYNAHFDVLQRWVNDLIIVRETIKLESGKIEPNTMVHLNTVSVRMRVSTSSCTITTYK